MYKEQTGHISSQLIFVFPEFAEITVLFRDKIFWSHTNYRNFSNKLLQTKQLKDFLGDLRKIIHTIIT